ncbi:MAG: hypothetical protein VB144_15300, partial [Clostridia bacterium]|nr:hypothetical protein [Clostridia bacterium]
MLRRRNTKLMVSLAIASSLILWGFAVCCSAAAPPLGASDAVWIRYMKTDYGLDEKEVQPLRTSGMGWPDIASYLESLYPHAPITIGTDDFAELAHGSGITPLEAIEAYKLGVRSHIDPAWLSSIYREAGSWDRIATALAHRDQANKLVSEGNTKASSRQAQTAVGQTLASVYGLPSYALDRAFGIAGDEETLINAMFVLEIASDDDPAAEMTDLEQLIPVLKRSAADLQPLSEPWTLRKFPVELLPLVPPSSLQARTLARPATVATSAFPRYGDVGATASGSTSSIIDPSVLYGTSRVSPFKAYFDGFVETVDPSSGALTVRHTDFTLPGRGGLDFSLTRVYNSGLAGFDLPRVHAKYVETEDDCHVTKVWGEKIPNTYFDRRFGLGVGWRFAFPTIEFTDGQKFLHMDDGGVYKIGGGYYDDVGYYLVDYDVQDMTFSADKSYVSSLDGAKSEYRLRRKDGVKWLFGSDGRLLCTRDRFGNEIKFQCEVPSGGLARIVRAVDTVGRQILFSYEVNRVVVTVNPGDASQVLTWTYALETADANHSGRKKLVTATPPAGRPTSYGYSVRGTTFTPYVDGMTGSPMGFDYISLTSICHQGNTCSSAATMFQYAEAHRDLTNDDPSRNDPSDLGYFRVTRRWDEVPTTVVDGAGLLTHPIEQNGEVEFTYQPWDTSSASYGCTRTPKRHGAEAGVAPASESWRFDKKHRPASHSATGIQSGSDRNQTEVVTTAYSYVGDDGKLPMRDVKTIKVGISPSRQETTKYTWDGRGNLVTTIDPAGRKTESWYDDKYALLTMRAEETTAPDGSRAARVLENKLDSDKKAVEEQWTYMAQPSTGGATTYTADIVSSEIPERSFWIWSPAGAATSVTLRIGWSVKLLFDVAKYQIYYRELGTSAWTYYGGKSHWGLPQTSSDTWNITLSSTPKRYDVKVAVVYSPIWTVSASAIGPGPAWAPKNAAEISKQALQYDQTYKSLPIRSSILSFGSSGEESVTTYRYDDAWRLFPTFIDTPVRNANGAQSVVRTEARYDGYGRVIEYNKYTVGDSSAGASHSCFTYDVIGRLLTAERPAQSQTGGYVRPTYSRVYDDQNFIIAISDELGHKTRETYDGLGRFVLAEQEETSGSWRQVAHVRYDSLGRTAREYDAFSIAHETKYEYDAFGRRIRTYYPREANVSEYDRAFSESWNVSAGPLPPSLCLPAFPLGTGYAAGYASAVRWEKESATRKASEPEHPAYRGYDISGRLIWSAAQTGPGPNDWAVSCYEYDALDRPVASWVYTQGNAWDKTSYEYGLHLDAPTAMTLPGDGSPEPKHEYRYDSRGLKIAEDPGKPYAISFVYDEFGRMKTAVYSDPAAPMSSRLFYDHDGRITRGELYKSGTLQNRTAAAYNLRGWLTSETWTIDGASYSLGYAYDNAGNRIRMTYPSGATFDFEYDNRNRLVRIPGYFGPEGQPAQKGFAYDANGFLTGATAVNGVNSAYAADAQGRLKSITVAKQQPFENMLQLAYSYASQGNISSISGANGGSPFELNYGYDWISRLTFAQVPKPAGIATVAYQYDGAGNRKAEIWSDSGTVQYQYLPGNYLWTRGAATYAWGPYGQLISKTDGAATINYEYSAQRLMNAAKVSGATAANYQYDALGRRVKAVEGETTIVTLHSGNDIVYEVRKARRQEQAQ